MQETPWRVRVRIRRPVKALYGYAYTNNPGDVEKKRAVCSLLRGLMDQHMSDALYIKQKNTHTMDNAITITTALTGTISFTAALVGVASSPVSATTGVTMQVDALAALFDKLATDVWKLKARTASHVGISKKKTYDRQHCARTGPPKFSPGRPGAVFSYNNS